MIASAALILLSASAAEAASCDLFVSYATGSDTMPGTSVTAPLKTLQHALYIGQGVARTICLRSDGTPHVLDQPLCINSRSSSLPSAPLTITGYAPDIAAGKGAPIISGGVTVGLSRPMQKRART